MWTRATAEGLPSAPVFFRWDDDDDDDGALAGVGRNEIRRVGPARLSSPRPESPRKGEGLGGRERLPGFASPAAASASQ